MVRILEISFGLNSPILSGIISLLAFMIYSQLSSASTAKISAYSFKWSEHQENKIAIKVTNSSGDTLIDTASDKSFVELYRKNSVVREKSGFFKRRF